MNDADWDVLGRYVRTVANTIGLRDWFLLLKHEAPTDDDLLAEVRAIYGRKYAVLRVCHEFRELSRDETRQVVVHELVHCHHATLGHVLTKTLTQQLGHVGELLMIPIQAELEHLVDAIATEWAQGLPYIEWTTADPTAAEMVNVPYEGPIDHG